MQAIKSIQQLEKLIDSYTESHQNVFNNFYLYGNEIQRVIRQGRLFYDEAQDGLFFFCDEGSFYRLYFYVNKGNVIDVSKDKPVICEILFSEGQEEQRRVIEHTMQNFCLNKLSQMYSLNLKENENFINEVFSSLINRLSDEIKIRYATPEDLPVLRRFWEQYLDPFDFTYMSEEELISCMANGEIAVAESRDYGVVATSWKVQKGNISFGQHLAVSETTRGKNLGLLMMLDTMKKALEEGASVRTCWLELSNILAMQLHIKLNFTPTKRLSMQFVK